MIAKELAVVKVDEYVMTKDGHVSVVADTWCSIARYS